MKTKTKNENSIFFIFLIKKEFWQKRHPKRKILPIFTGRNKTQVVQIFCSPSFSILITEQFILYSEIPEE